MNYIGNRHCEAHTILHMLHLLKLNEIYFASKFINPLTNHTPGRLSHQVT